MSPMTVTVVGSAVFIDGRPAGSIEDYAPSEVFQGAPMSDPEAPTTHDEAPAPYGAMYGFPSDEEMFAAGLYVLCQTMVMAASGSADGMTADELDHWIAYLRRRLDEWREPTSRWDAAVRDMVLAALAEVCESRQP